jgi:lysine N6-hydroxylase
MTDPLSIVKRATLGQRSGSARVLSLGAVQDLPVLDFIGVGLGPFNLGLACLLEPVKELTGLFLDARAEFNWHPGMLLDSTRLQTPHTADLVTMADPTSRFSFLNYAKQNSQLYSFCIRENIFLLRREYNRYCQWASRQLSNVQFNRRVVQLRYLEAEQQYLVKAQCCITQAYHYYRCRKLILGTGTSPHWPAAAKTIAHKAIHSSDYLTHKSALLHKRKIAIVGSGQSAAEIFYDLLQQASAHNYQLHWLTRSAQFAPLEYNKLSLELTSPDYLTYFSSLAAPQRKQLLASQAHLYKGINRDLLDAIFDCLYEQKLAGHQFATLNANAELHAAEFHSASQTFHLDFYQRQQQQAFSVQTDAVILATGYSYAVPDFLRAIASHICWDEQGQPQPNQHYAIDLNGNSLYAQNLGLQVHGFVTPDLSMAAYRNSIIVNQLAGREVYAVEQRIAFQDFFAPSTTAHFTAQELQVS